MRNFEKIFVQAKYRLHGNGMTLREQEIEFRSRRSSQIYHRPPQYSIGHKFNISRGLATLNG